MVVFFLVALYCWTMARIILHECAHMIAGRLAEFGISYVLVGTGAKLLDFRRGKIRFIIRAYPSGGATITSSLPAKYTRLKELAYSSAGLVVELSALGVLIWLYSMEAVRDSKYDLTVFVLLFAQSVSVLQNAIPLKLKILGSKTPNDGMRIWQTLRGRDLYRDYSADEFLENTRQYDSDFPAEDVWLRRASMDEILAFGNDIIVLVAIDEEAGFHQVERYLEGDLFLPAEKAYVCDILASTQLRSKKKPLLKEAYTITQRGLTYVPKAHPLTCTLGCLQIELGMIDEGIDTLTPLSGEDSPLKDKSLCCAYLAKAHAGKGDKQRMKTMLKACKKSDKSGLIHRRFSKQAKAALRQARRRAR